MAINVQEFLKAAAKHWNKIKQNASVKEIDRFVATLTEASYECTEGIEVFVFDGFVSVLLPQIQELKEKLSLQTLPTVQTEDNDFVEAEFVGFATNFSSIQPVGNDEDDSEEDSQADIQTILLPVAAVVEDEDVPVNYPTCWINSFEPVQDSDIDDTEPEDFNV